MSRIAILTLCTDRVLDYGQYAISMMRSYCIKQGYAFIQADKSPVPDKHIFWAKIPMILKELSTGRYDWVMWCDLDTAIEDMSVRLEGFLDNKADLLMSADQTGMNAGHYFVANNWRSKRFLTHCFMNPSTHELCDQVTMQNAIFDNPWMIRARCLGDAVARQSWQRGGHFMTHLCGENNQFRKAYLQTVIGKVKENPLALWIEASFDGFKGNFLEYAVGKDTICDYLARRGWTGTFMVGDELANDYKERYRHFRRVRINELHGPPSLIVGENPGTSMQGSSEMTSECQMVVCREGNETGTLGSGYVVQRHKEDQWIVLSRTH